MRAQGIIDRDGRERTWVAPEEQGLGLGLAPEQVTGQGSEQGQGVANVENNTNNNNNNNNANNNNDINRLVLPPLTPTSTSLQSYPHYLTEVSRYHNLKYAYVHDTVAMTYLAKAMFNHPLITHLVLPQVVISTLNTLLPSAYLRALPEHISYLQEYFNILSSIQHTVFNRPPPSPLLPLLVFPQCKLTDDAVVVLSSCLSTLHALIYLDLSANCIGDDGALALALALQKGVEENSVKNHNSSSGDSVGNKNVDGDNNNNDNDNNDNDNNDNDNNDDDENNNNHDTNIDDGHYEDSHSNPSSPHHPSSPSSPLFNTSYGHGSAPGPGLGSGQRSGQGLGPGPGVSSVWSVVSLSSPQTAKEANERARLLGATHPHLPHINPSPLTAKEANERARLLGTTPTYPSHPANTLSLYYHHHG